MDIHELKALYTLLITLSLQFTKRAGSAGVHCQTIYYTY